MKARSIQTFTQIPQPARESFGFLEDIRSPTAYHFRPGSGCPAGKTAAAQSKKKFDDLWDELLSRFGEDNMRQLLELMHELDELYMALSQKGK